MPVYEAPDDDADDAPRQSYNFAPGYYGLVYRADVPDWGAGPRQHKKGEGKSADQDATETPASTAGSQEVRYKLQSMKWGLIPFCRYWGSPSISIPECLILSRNIIDEANAKSPVTQGPSAILTMAR